MIGIAINELENDNLEDGETICPRLYAKYSGRTYTHAILITHNTYWSFSSVLTTIFVRSRRACYFSAGASRIRV